MYTLVNQSPHPPGLRNRYGTIPFIPGNVFILYCTWNARLEELVYSLFELILGHKHLCKCIRKT